MIFQSLLYIYKYIYLFRAMFEQFIFIRENIRNLQIVRTISKSVSL